MENDYGYLDKIRLRDGAEKCREEYREAFLKNRWDAVNLVNDLKITFPCLYILLPEIKAFNFFRYLSSRNLIVIDIINQIMAPRGAYFGTDYLSEANTSIYSILKWIFNTGYNENIDDDYEHIIDVIVSVLVNIYDEKDIISEVTELIFLRHNTGRCYNDLVWALMRLKDPEALKKIAEHLKSDNKDEADFAADLLNIEDIDEVKSIPINKIKYDRYIKWLIENDPYLYFTEESNQYSSKPIPIKADLERKYLDKGISSYDKNSYHPINENEIKCLSAFKPLPEDDKKTLSEYSNKVKQNDKAKWENWIKSPIEEQIKEAKASKGDLV